MGHLLKNQNIEIEIDLPFENYQFSRFDWTGKITNVKFKQISLTNIENIDAADVNVLGKGFYNEFGIETPLGFDETKIGEKFHKIGVGLLKKIDNQYAFHKLYKIEPLDFQISTNNTGMIMNCIAPVVNGYAYELLKEIELCESGFAVKYFLKNTGEKIIQTDEYAHNFLSINKEFIDSDYSLNFPFQIEPELFGETINPESSVTIGKQNINFQNSPNKQFFFSNLSGGDKVDASWELKHLRTKIGIREFTNFQTKKVNLWGWKHVVCPELFFDINIAPGESQEWTRRYEVFEI
jgi:hypothetical protein